MSDGIAAEAGLFARLNGIPSIDLPTNVHAALSAGRRMTSILTEIVSLRRGAGRLTPNEYFYYRLWDPALSAAEKSRFVGKQAQNAMHIACNDAGWYATAADKLLFQTVMTGAGLPVPPLLAVTRAGLGAGDTRIFRNADEIAVFLREPEGYPLFAKPIKGKYSLSVISADEYDAASDEVLLLGSERRGVDSLADELTAGAGYLIQRRLDPDPRLAAMFGRDCGRFASSFWSAHPAPSSIAPSQKSRPGTTRPTISGGAETCSAQSTSTAAASAGSCAARAPK
jgi:hypothetical protein